MMTLRFVKSLDVFRTRLSYFTSVQTMGALFSCGKKGSITIAGNQSDFGSSGQNMSTQAEDFSVVEGVVCSESDIPNEGLKGVELNGTKILLAKTNGVVHAIGAKCSHYGLPLEKGSLCNGRIRCPFHGACFNVETGDIEDFPGLDSIPKFDVEVSDGNVRVRAKKSALESKTRVKDMTKRDPNNNQTFVVVGGGAAGANCVETLRQEGFSGRLLLLGAEEALPYDRPKLSKAMHLNPDALALRSSAFYQEADIEVKLGAAVTQVDVAGKNVTTSTGEQINFDKLFLATGGRPRTLSVNGSDLKGVFVLRTPSDGNDIVTKAKGKKVVVIGSSFIGMETAAYLASEERCLSVTVVGSSSVPFKRSLGTAVGERIQRMFEEKGVKFVNSAQVTRLEGSENVEKVIVNDGEELLAEVVVAGVGVLPSTEFLAGSEVLLDSRGFVPVNEEMETNVPDVYCGGDIAAFPLFLPPQPSITIGHWQMALMHGHVAAVNMVGKKRPLRSVPFFWTVLFGKSLRYTGYGQFDDVIIAGDLEELAFIAYYCHGNDVVAVASLGKDPAAANYANYLFNRGSFFTKDQVLADPEIVMNLKC